MKSKKNKTKQNKTKKKPKTKKKKPKKKKRPLLILSFWNFSLPPSRLQFPFFSSPFPPFSFLPCLFIPVGEQKFPGQKSEGTLPPCPPPVTPLSDAYHNTLKTKLHGDYFAHSWPMRVLSANAHLRMCRKPG